MPYRIDLADAGDDAIDPLVELGALDVERCDDGGLAALMPDHVAPEHVAETLGLRAFSVAPAAGRDAYSTWVLTPREALVGGVRIVPAHAPATSGALRLVDGAAFGTGGHSTTALCLELLADMVDNTTVDAMLDVGTGSGVLALAALMLGVPQAVGVDTDDEALRVAAENARINELSGRIRLVRGGPDAIAGMWPLVLANILAAPLIALAPAMVPRVGRHGRLVLSGISVGLEEDVHRAYRHQGMRLIEVRRRATWSALVLQASW